MNNKTKAPNFLGLIDENEHLGLDNFKGEYLVIYFYPKDKTSGCTIAVSYTHLTLPTKA